MLKIKVDAEFIFINNDKKKIPPPQNIYISARIHIWRDTLTPHLTLGSQLNSSPSGIALLGRVPWKASLLVVLTLRHCIFLCLSLMNPKTYSPSQHCR